MRNKILSLHAQGLNNKQIAKELGMCPSSITYNLRADYRQRHYEHLKKRRLTHKKQALQYKGNKCQLCGYSKCKSAMEFHHPDPLQKDPRLIRRSGRMANLPFDSMKKELDKCVLLCANCHREIHEGIVQLP